MKHKILLRTIVIILALVVIIAGGWLIMLQPSGNLAERLFVSVSMLVAFLMIIGVILEAMTR